MYFFETDEVTLVGSSPETLVKVENGAVEMHPIAGSRPRGITDEEDDRLRDELLADPKERAEHVMLVDLGRNDVGRVSEVGSVRVTELMDVRRYSHVMHIESTVVGTLAEGRRASDALRAIFPAGTLSGRPQGAGDGDHRRAGDHQAGARTAAPSATSGGTGASTPASRSAPSCAATASRTCRRARASWPTPSPRPSTRRPRTRPPPCSARSRSPRPRSDW